MMLPALTAKREDRASWVRHGDFEYFGNVILTDSKLESFPRVCCEAPKEQPQKEPLFSWSHCASKV